MRRYGKHTDEDDIRIRPGRRGTRPRTSIRPKHEDAAEGMVLTVDRGRLTCLVEDRIVMAMKARELGRKAAVVGDRVALVGDLSGAKDTLARVVRIGRRDSVLRRTADDDDPFERVVVANADQLAIVTALADPEPRPRLIDRCLVAAYDGGLDPLLVLTKSDLAPPDKLLPTYEALGVPYVVTSREELETGDAADQVRALLDDKITAFVGHSGVGKTTLVNSLVPKERRRTTGVVNAVTGRGRHTTTSALALPLAEPGEDGPRGWVIDTPGVRSFGLAHVDPSRVIHAFPDLVPGTAECPRACSHDEPDCALDDWVAEGHAEPARLYSLRRLLATRERREGD
ncbi:ribosome small subunit-dependent GTPase A [Streptomyces odontomachi]|uniref:ribosome small subunit-dependent GTPase A n=1 Tax=Streptomyces odontomachi TaxID=2944940 RepID=UPI00210BDA13|nr:ribosome small subunit-dependent GTPase A [Streptomyces sp. ODS25]